MGLDKQVTHHVCIDRPNYRIIVAVPEVDVLLQHRPVIWAALQGDS